MKIMKWVSLVGVMVMLTGVCQLPVVLEIKEIHVNQIGYLPGDEKIAVIADPQVGYNSAVSYVPPGQMLVKDAFTNATVFTGNTVLFNSGVTHGQSGDKLWRYDFSSLTVPGVYYVYDPSRQGRSDFFNIGDTVYDDVMKVLVKMLYYQRSGFAKSAPYAHANGVDGVAFNRANQDLAVRAVGDPNNAATERDLRGGWFDAGDYNKYTLFGVDATASLLTAYQMYPSSFTDDIGIPESGDGIADVLNEAKWEIDWVLRMYSAGNGVLYKVAPFDKNNWSTPPSSDTTVRYYGPASTATTFCASALFAQAAKVYTGLSGMATFVSNLTTAAENAWTWGKDHPNVPGDNTGFNSADPDSFGGASYYKRSCKLRAAVYLYDLTGTAEYKTFVEGDYTNADAMVNTYWKGFRPNVGEQDALLRYASLGGVTVGVADAIKASKMSSTSLSNFFGQVAADTDGYRSLLGDAEYVWGSNGVKGQTGALFGDVVKYGLDTGNDVGYKKLARRYWHYLMGVNPVGLVYVTNMASYGAERSARQMWSQWWFRGSAADVNGPPPGYVTGGANDQYESFAQVGCVLNPPANQPPQKSYADTNENFTNNADCASYTITEPGIYYQTDVIKLLAMILGQK